jgi:hypothetical protein
MPKVVFEGKTHEFPEGTTPEEIAAILDATAPGVKVANISPYTTAFSWKETPEQRRRAAQDQLAIFQHESTAASGQDKALLGQLISRAAMVSTAANPHDTARAVKPQTVYRKLFNDR